MGRLFPLPDAKRHDPAVKAWWSQQKEEFGTLAEYWFEVMRACGDDVCELLHDGHPTACIGELAFAYVNVFTAHVNVGFYGGADLSDPAGLLEGTGKFMRHVKLKPEIEVNTAALKTLIQVAYLDMKKQRDL